MLPTKTPSSAQEPSYGTGASLSRRPPVVPGYDLLRMVGRGGMGVVWEAREHRFDRTVALKVHAGEGSVEAATQLWSEARLAAKVGHPGVVSVYDFGETLDGRPYYTMELVQGTDLHTLLREGALPQARVLALGTEIAEAVAAAHDRGIVHGDLKARNVIVDAGGHARVLDFGLARPITNVPTRVVMGSPAYMAPELVGGGASSAHTDVWAMGIVLYEMLVGERPFDAETAGEMLIKIATQPVPLPSQRGIAVQPDVERAILQCLQKEPADRYPSARALADTLRALSDGRPPPSLVPASYAPRLPAPLAETPALAPARDAAKVHVRIALRLASPPAALWPLVAHTERFNKAIGLPAVAFVDSPDARGGSSRTGSFRRLGMQVAWEEHPFEWIKEREHAVHRRYTDGPLAGLWNRVRLQALSDGGTEIVHEIWAQPKGIVGRLAAWFEIRQRAARAIPAVYRHIDAQLARGDGGDAFEPPHRPTAAQRDRAQLGAAQLTRGGFPVPLVRRLVDLLLYAPGKALESLRPYALADAWGERRDETLDLFLHAANAGLVDVAWDLICPDCLLAHEHAVSLRGVRQFGSCAACNATTFERDLARSVELVFRPHSAVRTVTRSTYCAGSPGLRPHVLVQQLLSHGEAREVSVVLPPGSYRVSGPRLSAFWFFDVSPAALSSTCGVVIHEVSGPQPIDAGPGVLRAGPIMMRLVNASGIDQVLRVERAGAREDSVTAAVALTHPAFREFFSEELLAHGEHLAVSQMAFLLIDVDDRQALVEELGDAAAFAVVASIDAIVAREVRREQGAVVETSFALGHLATFANPAQALRSAVAIQTAAREEKSPARLRAAIHSGRCVVVTRADRLEYFGETLQRTAALLPECPAGGVALSARSADDYDAAAALHAAGLRVEVGPSSSRSYKDRRVVRLLPP